MIFCEKWTEFTVKPNREPLSVKTTRLRRASRYEKFGMDVCPSTVGNYLHSSLDFSFKRISPVPERWNDPDIISLRRDYAFKFKFLDMDRNCSKLFFIGETGIQIHARLNYRWSKRCENQFTRKSRKRSRLFNLCCDILWTVIFLSSPRERKRAYGIESFVEYLKIFLQKLEPSSIIRA